MYSVYFHTNCVTPPWPLASPHVVLTQIHTPFITTHTHRYTHHSSSPHPHPHPHTDTHTIRVPQVFHVGSLSERSGGSFIVMEYLNFSGRYSDAEFGRQLALMHLAEPTV